MVAEFNYIKDSDIIKTYDPANPVQIRIGKEGVAAEEPISIPRLLQRTARDYSDRIALKFKTNKNDKTWNSVTYRYVLFICIYIYYIVKF